MSDLIGVPRDRRDLAGIDVGDSACATPDCNRPTVPQLSVPLCGRHLGEVYTFAADMIASHGPAPRRPAPGHDRPAGCMALWASSSNDGLRYQGDRCGRVDVRRLGDVPLCDHHWERAVDDAERHVRQRLGILAQSQQERRREMEAASVVYYLQRTDELIKIGFSSQLQKRIKDLSERHGPLQVLATHRGHRDAERQMHALFQDDRVEGEWFLPSDELLAHIERINTRRLASA